MIKSNAMPNSHSLSKTGMGLFAATLAAAALVCTIHNARAETAVMIPPPAAAVTAGIPANPAAQDTAVFAGGCFWGIQAVFQHTRGVLNAVSGYAGGAKENAEYGKVSSGNTGHAESVQVSFDPQQISYGKLLQIYFSVAHDPTQLNRQYPDSGTQYRSAVFYKDAAQKQIAERYIAQLDNTHLYHAKIVTQLSPLTAFYAAEKYHQDYATLHPESGYIAHFDLPKIANLKKLYPDLYRETPVLVASQASGMAKTK
ncbi:peptide-methionine (S)-S-oxide reductase MsrA [Undibacterium sp.]|jgi:peptide-methionine (S)-S-oxide reductase|uniref:peptide-methionine (S)-S-oxide reductase MsrA n=1 Tax=Undibacterium sp. TaxID=1914977 RepID=UPI002D1B6F88|nr:peptide-methionine (S)-S-oxide reductase MsrA [Undibacterium sp.]HTD02503.1 peptide-methionine (S)-S-oxide reductase MsrA [Undibacterium sp.]